jgi:hypothetical protein
MVQKDTKVRTTLDDTGGKSVSQKSMSTVAKSKSEYFVSLGYSEARDNRTGKNNGLEFLIVWRDFPTPFTTHGSPLDSEITEIHLILLGEVD